LVPAASCWGFTMVPCAPARERATLWCLFGVTMCSIPVYRIVGSFCTLRLFTPCFAPDRGMGLPRTQQGFASDTGTASITPDARHRPHTPDSLRLSGRLRTHGPQTQAVRTRPIRRRILESEGCGSRCRAESPRCPLTPDAYLDTLGPFVVCRVGDETALSASEGLPK